MFYTVISKSTVDEIFSIFFRNLGLISHDTDLVLRELEFDGDEVIVRADVDMETIN